MLKVTNTRWWHIARSLHPWIRKTTQWGGPGRSRDKLNPLYFHLQETHGHQTRHAADLQWEASIFKVTWLFDHVKHMESRENLKNLYFHYQKALNVAGC